MKAAAAKSPPAPSAAGLLVHQSRAPANIARKKLPPDSRQQSPAQSANRLREYRTQPRATVPVASWKYRVGAPASAPPHAPASPPHQSAPPNMAAPRY